MALEHAILVSLAETGASGYELTRRFDRSLGLFWHASHQQIYRTLARMEADGLVASTTVEQQGRPDRRDYDVTPAGLETLASWVGEAGPVEQSRSALAVRVRGLRHGDPDAVRAEVQRHRDAHADRLEQLRRSRERHYPGAPDVRPDELGPYLVLRGGIRTEEAVVDWCDEVLSALDASAARAPRSAGSRDR